MLSTDDILFNWAMITGDETEKEEVLHEIVNCGLQQEVFLLQNLSWRSINS